MGRYSRSRKVREKKVKMKPGATGSVNFDDEDTSGTMMSMRSGLKKIAGGEEEGAASTSGATTFIWVLVGIVAVIFFFMLAR